MARTMLAVVPGSVDSTSLYRGFGPIGALKHQTDLVVSIATQVTWAVMKLCDFVFLQRPFRPEHWTVIEIAKKGGKPVWVDYDDDLFTVPPDNPSHGTYGDPAVQKVVAQCIAGADVVTVATPRLAQVFGQLNRNMRVIPNAFDDELLELEEPTAGERPCVIWRGSQTHQRDLLAHGRQLIEVAKAHPQWTFNFCGYNPWFITEQMAPNQAVVTPPIDPLDFFAFMRAINPAILVVPLAPNRFNLGKSNIAWIEGTYAGAVCLAPNTPEWQRPGIVNYEGAEDFGAKLRQLMAASRDDRAKLLKASWQYIMENLLLTKQPTQERIGVVNYLDALRQSPEWRTAARSGLAWRGKDGQPTGKATLAPESRTGDPNGGEAAHQPLPADSAPQLQL